MKVMIIDQDWMTPAERRMEIIKLLCYRRQDTMKNLADELGVTSRTIQNDINYLSLSYPLETIRGRYGGGVRVTKGYYLDRKYFNPRQKELLEKLKVGLSGDDLAIMKSIFRDFTLKS